MTTRSCNALLALRMRVSMSATGSVSIAFLLPARLRHSGNCALVGELAQADPAEPELAEHRARPAAAVAARVVARLEPLRALLLDDQRLLGQLTVTSGGHRARCRRKASSARTQGALVAGGYERD